MESDRAEWHRYGMLGVGVAAILVACGKKTVTHTVSTSPVSCPESSSATVTLYGRPGSLGAPRVSVPTGQDLELEPINGWQLDPGQTAYFSTVAPDGTVFIANLPQTANEIMPTACDMPPRLVTTNAQAREAGCLARTAPVPKGPRRRHRGRRVRFRPSDSTLPRG
jgi:hypothetical protein